MSCNEIPDSHKSFTRGMILKKKSDRNSLIDKLNLAMEEAAYFTSNETVKIELPFKNLDVQDIVNISAYLKTKIASVTDEYVEFYLSTYYKHIQTLLKSFNPVFKYAIDKAIMCYDDEIVIKIDCELNKSDKIIIQKYLIKLGYNGSATSFYDTEIRIPINYKV